MTRILDAIKAPAGAEHWDAGRTLAGGFAQFGPHIAIASSFGLEDVVLIDLAGRIQRGFSVFTLDTGFLFPQTYDLIERVEERYGIEVERVQPELSPDEQTRAPAAGQDLTRPNAGCTFAISRRPVHAMQSSTHSS